MEITVKTAEFGLIAANYDEMFNGFLKVVAELYPETSDPQVLNHYKGAVKSEISWAKQHLKKQDRIVWYLRWIRLMLIKDVTRDDQNAEAKYLKPEMDRLSKLVGSDVSSYRVLRVGYNSEIQRLHHNLDHFLSLPIPDITNTVFDKQAPDTLFSQFKHFEDAWQEKAKGLLLPHEGDEIILQFGDGWAWWKLGRGYCPEEAKAMGHCGNVNGQYNRDERILSLRKPQKFGNETRWEPFLTFILDGDGFLGEMKGRANERPSSKYHSYIAALLERSDIVKGIKGGGYKPTHNFHLDDLDWNTVNKLKQKNPYLKTCVDRLNELHGKPDQPLINRISKSDKVPGYYDQRYGGWVVEEWSNPAKFIEDQLGDHSDVMDAYRLFTGENPPYERDYKVHQTVRWTLERLPIEDIVAIDNWLKSSKAESAGANLGRRKQHREILIRHIFGSEQQPEPIRRALEAVKVKVYDIYKAGITDAMRADIGDQLKQALEEAWSRKGTTLDFDKQDFWNGSVTEIMPLPTAAGLADGQGEDDDGEDDEEDMYDYDDEENIQVEYRYHDPYDRAYDRALQTLSAKVKKLPPDERKKVEKWDSEFVSGDRQPFIAWAEKVMPGAFKDADAKGWSVRDAHRAAVAEFGQIPMFPVPTEKEHMHSLTDREIEEMQYKKDMEAANKLKQKKQHASLLFQKDATFEIIAADYEGMFTNVLALAGTDDKVRDYKATVDHEIAWAKKALKKQDRIVWWLRWFRLGLLSDIYTKAENERVYAEGRFLQMQKQQEHWQGQHDHYVKKNLTPPPEWATMPPELTTELNQLQQTLNGWQQREEALKKAYNNELRAMSNRTGQEIHGGSNLSWFQRTHHEMEHFLSLPTPGIQNVVWDKQTPLDLQQTFQKAEKEWQDRTRGLLKPQTTVDVGERKRRGDVSNLNWDLNDMERKLKILQDTRPNREWFKRDAEGNIVAVSMTEKPGYEEFPEEELLARREQEIADMEEAIQKQRDKINEIINEVDTIFLQFQDGWAWWKLSRAYCSEEGRAMGHCGNVTGQDKTNQRILSLRQPKKVGSETYWEPHLTFILEPNGFLGEMKGKNNEKPAAKYHPYILALIEDPRIKGLKGGGYAPERNFSFKDLTPEQQTEALQKNPNLNGCQVMLQQKGVTPELIQKIEALLGFDEDGDTPTKFQNPIDPKQPKIAGWVTETWKSINDFVQDRGNDSAKWVSEQLEGGGDYFDYADHVSWSEAFNSMDKKHEDTLRRFIEVEHPEAVEEWIERQKEDGEEDPDFGYADLQEVISDSGLDEVESSLWRCVETGMRYGAEEEMHDALTKALDNYELEETGEQLLLPKYITKEGKEGMVWDSPVHLYLDVQRAAQLADRGEPLQFYSDEGLRSNDDAELKVDQPYYGWSGWSQSGFDDNFDEEFGGPQREDEKKRKEEEEAKAKAQAKKTKKKKPGDKKKKKQRASRIAAVPEWHAGKSGELLKKLKALPYADDIMVFGSVSRGKEQPGDIDLYIDLRGKGKHPAWQELMALAKEYHGGLDPFIIADDGEKDGKPIYKVWGRNESATGWVPSRNADAMLKSMQREGRPLTSILPFRPTAAKKSKEEPVIEAHRTGSTMWIDWMSVPEEMRGKGVGRSVYTEWEARLPKDITLVRLFAADAGEGPAAPFWEKMGFHYVYDRETYDYELDGQMWKGVNGHATPKSIEPYENDEENYGDDSDQ